jgi:hypothetical protein
MTGEPAVATAQEWRERAADCRREAAVNRSSASVEAWLRLARRYEEFAKRAEAEAALAAAQSKSEA